ncbi:MAG: outer rane adhesin like protein, partial [Firmicutes bacterium]|nr:outer rane adhesin like protein [Bacillota bacterium]
MRARSILSSIFVALLLMLQWVPSASALTRTIISVGANMNFGTPSQPDPTNPNLYKYTNVVTKSGIQVDALVTVAETVNATLAKIDDGAQYVPRFNPTISTSADGYVRFRFDFIDHATNQPVWLKDFYLTSVDLDGDPTYQEFNEISGFESYTLDKTTKLTVGPSANGRTRFTGMSTTVNGIPFQDNDAFIANYTAPVSSMDVVLGVNAAVSSARLFSVNFGLLNAVGTFTTPVPYPNGDSPTINVQIADGGDSYLTAVDNLQNVTISGTTTSESGQPVNLEITGSDNKTTVWETISDGAGYTATGDLSAIPDGLVTVVASTVNVAGNPASAKATSTKDMGTSTTVSCVPATTAVNSPVTCTATVTDKRATMGSDPDGNVNWSAGSGTFDATSCVLASGSCSVSYTPASAAPSGVSVTAAYQGTAVRKASIGSTSVVVNDVVILTPASATVYVKSTRQFSVAGGVGGYTYAVQTNNSSGATINSTGLYTSGLTGDVTDTIAVTDTKGTQGIATIQVNKRPTATKVTCTPAELMVGTTATCNVTVTDISGQATQVPVTGTVTFANSGNGSWGSAGVCTLTNGKCSVTYTPAGTGTHMITAGYEGSASHAVSNSLDTAGNSQSLTADAALTIAPPTAQVPVFGAQTFTATGGVGALAFNIAGGASAAKGSVGASTGNYSGGNQAGTVVTVQVQDTQGNTADGTVTLVRRVTAATVDCFPAATDKAAPVT